MKKYQKLDQIDSSANELTFPAKYTEQKLLEYNGNPLIEALPDINTINKVYESIGNYPQHNDKERELPYELRLHCVNRIKQLIIPMNIHFDVEQRISRLIRYSYTPRNPFEKRYTQLLNLGSEAIKNKDLKYLTKKTFIQSTANSFTIIGISGLGKTTMIERILSLYPQVIQHTRYKDVSMVLHQIVWLKLDCPFDGSVKGLCLNFFQAIDSILGTEYHGMYSKNITVDQLLPIMAQKSNLHAIGLIVIDEIQNLSQAKSGGVAKMLNFFVQLVNTLGVPIITIGTPKAIKLLNGEFRNARRGSGQGDLIWQRMDFEKEWNYFIEELWKYQWTEKVCDLTDDIKQVLYEESQGITDIATKLYIIAQWRAISTGIESIDSKLIKSVAKDSLKLVKPALEALKRGKIQELEMLEDVYIPEESLESYIGTKNKNYLQLMKAKEILQDKAQMDNIMQVAEWLIQAGFDGNISGNIASKVVQDSNKDTNIVELKNNAIKLMMKYNQDLEENNDNDKKNSGENTKENKTKAVQKNKTKEKKEIKTGYKEVKEIGMIKEIDEL